MKKSIIILLATASLSFASDSLPQAARAGLIIHSSKKESIIKTETQSFDNSRERNYVDSLLKNLEKEEQKEVRKEIRKEKAWKIIEVIAISASAITVAAATAYYSSETVSTYNYNYGIAENGDIYGVDNDGDGKIETIFVKGHYRDGIYVKSHYRATY